MVIFWNRGFLKMHQIFSLSTSSSMEFNLGHCPVKHFIPHLLHIKLPKPATGLLNVIFLSSQRLSSRTCLPNKVMMTSVIKFTARSRTLYEWSTGTRANIYCHGNDTPTPSSKKKSKKDLILSLFSSFYFAKIVLFIRLHCPLLVLDCIFIF